MLVHWIWLATRPFSDRVKISLLQHFSEPEEIYFADRGAFSRIEGLTKEQLEALEDKSLTQAEGILRQCSREKISILTYRDAGYPSKLKNIADPPCLLYYKGRLPDFDGSPLIGVVGTRRASAYGLTAAKRLGYQIARCGGIVVSGMAHGIDSMAMSGALTAGREVVGVLGCGADIVYPPSNKSLFADVENYGCILSEFPPGTPPIGWNFPKRNRIISGLSCGVLVVEAPEKSGALITAGQALEQGRDVFVVPGNIDVATCRGSNALLRDGAIAVSSGWDVVGEYAARFPGKVRQVSLYSAQTAYPDEVLDALKEEKTQPKVAQTPQIPTRTGKEKTKKKKKEIDNSASSLYSDAETEIPPLSETEQAIVSRLQKGCALVDDVIAATGMPAAAVSASLTMLQIKGVVTLLPGNRVGLKCGIRMESNHGK